MKDNKLKIVCNVELYIWNILPRATEPSARPAIGVGKFLIIFIDNSLYHYLLLLYNIKFESAIIIWLFLTNKVSDAIILIRNNCFLSEEV